VSLVEAARAAAGAGAIVATERALQNPTCPHGEPWRPSASALRKGSWSTSTPWPDHPAAGWLRAGANTKQEAAGTARGDIVDVFPRERRAAGAPGVLRRHARGNCASSTWPASARSIPIEDVRSPPTGMAPWWPDALRASIARWARGLASTPKPSTVARRAAPRGMRRLMGWPGRNRPSLAGLPAAPHPDRH